MLIIHNYLFLQTIIFSKRAKNGGVLGEEIFCPRAVGVNYASPPSAGWQFVSLDFVSLTGGLNLAKLL